MVRIAAPPLGRRWQDPAGCKLTPLDLKRQITGSLRKPSKAMNPREPAIVQELQWSLRADCPQEEETMKITTRFFAVLLSSLFVLAGCHELGHVEGLGDYGGTNSVMGEVRRVNPRNREIELRTDGGRKLEVRYDNRTRVTYRQRDYEVAHLEPGDYVALRTQQDRDGRLYTEQVTVRESAQDRSGRGRGSAGRLDHFEGTVEYIDGRRGTFEVRNRQKGIVLVTVPYDAPRSVSERFNRLREGDNVRVEGRFVAQDRFELENFV
jgi:hypothetical protein